MAGGFDLRDAPARAARPVAGAVAAAGGQLVQALDRWVGVQRGRIVLFDDDGVRARMTAHWLIQLGEDVHVHDGVPAAPPPPAPVALPPLDRVSAAEAAALLAASGRALSLDASAAFRTEHAAGALWSMRPRLASLPTDVTSAPVVVLFAADPAVAALAAIDLREQTSARLVAVEGGLFAWREAGQPVASSPSAPPDAERIDYLFWAHDRHDGNTDAMNTYLSWEEQLPAQITAEIGRGGFQLVR